MEDKQKSPDNARRRGIQSVEIGLQILQTLSELGVPSSLGSIAQACGIASPQVHRYLQSLIATGMARQDPASSRYELGPAAIQLGLSALARADAFRLIDKAIGEFVLRAGRTVQVAALGALGPTVVRWYSGLPGVITSLTIGSVLPILHSATGQVFLAFEQGVQAATLAKRELRRTPMSKSELDAVLNRVRDDGHAQVGGTVIPGLNATAFPIFDLQGRPILTATLLTLSVPDDPELPAAVDELGRLCQGISHDLGWPGHMQGDARP
jgi:DNA-binding IclR family transcriptional regulator